MKNYRYLAILLGVLAMAAEFSQAQGVNECETAMARADQFYQEFLRVDEKAQDSLANLKGIDTTSTYNGAKSARDAILEANDSLQAARTNYFRAGDRAHAECEKSRFKYLGRGAKFATELQKIENEIRRAEPKNEQVEYFADNFKKQTDIFVDSLSAILTSSAAK